MEANPKVDGCGCRLAGENSRGCLFRGKTGGGARTAVGGGGGRVVRRGWRGSAAGRGRLGLWYVGWFRERDEHEGGRRLKKMI